MYLRISQMSGFFDFHVLLGLLGTPEIFICAVFLDNMEIENFCVPSNFQMSGFFDFHVLLELLGTPDFFECLAFA